jgi:phospholipid/cholesterol/gamma-HCH transport system substrate-binding protein
VGLTVILAIIIVVVGVMWGTGQWVDPDSSTLTVYFEQAYGLEKDDPVTIAGVQQGVVAAVRFQDSRVYTDLQLDKKFFLPADSRIYIKNIGLMGERFVAIELGAAAETLDTSRPLAGGTESSISDVVGGLGGVLAKAERTLAGLDRIVGNPEFEKSINQSLRNLNELTRALGQVVAENRGDLAATVDDFRVTSRTLKEVVGSREAELKGAVDNFSGAAAQLKTTLAQLDELSASFKGLAARIEQSQGTLGALVNTKELHDKMLVSIANLDTLVKDVHANPGKYTQGIKFSLF